MKGNRPMTEMYRFETANFIVRATIEPDCDVDISWDETNETRDNLESGLWVAFNTDVTVSTRDGTVLGTDNICGSIYENPADFFKEHRVGPAYFSDLVRGAIAEARKTLERK
jgi:hypothetical protein